MVTLCVWIYVGSKAYMDDGYSLCLNIRWIWSIYGRWLLSVFEYTLDLKHISTMVTLCVWIYVGSEAYIDDGYSVFEYTLDLKHISTMVTLCFLYDLNISLCLYLPQYISPVYTGLLYPPYTGYTITLCISTLYSIRCCVRYPGPVKILGRFLQMYFLYLLRS